MSTIRNLFEATKALDRRIEKVISFDNDANDQLKREITEYVVTDLEALHPYLRVGSLELKLQGKFGVPRFFCIRVFAMARRPCASSVSTRRMATTVPFTLEAEL